MRIHPSTQWRTMNDPKEPKPIHEENDEKSKKPEEEEEEEEELVEQQKPR